MSGPRNGRNPGRVLYWLLRDDLRRATELRPSPNVDAPTLRPACAQVDDEAMTDTPETPTGKRLLGQLISQQPVKGTAWAEDRIRAAIIEVEREAATAALARAASAVEALVRITITDGPRTGRDRPLVDYERVLAVLRDPGLVTP